MEQTGHNRKHLSVKSSTILTITAVESVLDHCCTVVQEMLLFSKNLVLNPGGIQCNDIEYSSFLVATANCCILLIHA